MTLLTAVLTAVIVTAPATVPEEPKPVPVRLDPEWVDQHTKDPWDDGNVWPDDDPTYYEEYIRWRLSRRHES